MGGKIKKICPIIILILLLSLTSQQSVSIDLKIEKNNLQSITDDDLDNRLYDFLKYNELKNNNENVTIYGYIKDKSTNLPINKAKVFYPVAINQDYDVNYSIIETHTNEEGFYEIVIPKPNENLILYGRSQKYFMNVYYGEYPQDKDIFWANISLLKGRASESSVIKGYVKNQINNEPLSKAILIFAWFKTDEFNEFDINYTYTDKNGFFQINMTDGYIAGSVCHDEYMSFSISNSWIYAWDKVWMNISMDPMPKKNINVSGYVKDIYSDEPIQNVDVRLNWYDEQGNVNFLFFNNTTTDSDGYFSMKTTEGYIYLSFGHDDYETHFGDYIFVEDNTSIWYNITLQPIYSYYQYNWTKKTSDAENFNFNVDRKSSFQHFVTITSFDKSVLRKVFFHIDWIDDNTYGLFFNKGEDVLTVNISKDINNYSSMFSKGSGNYSFDFIVNNKPMNGTLLVENMGDAIDIVNAMIAGENEELFHITATVDTGEKIWRLFKFLKDDGNNFSMEVEYTYYTYTITKI